MVKTAIIIFLLFSLMYSYAAEVNYSKKADLPPLRIAFSDLQKILDKAASLMTSANSKDGFRLWEEKVRLYKNGHRVTISGHALSAERARLPQTIDRFDYTLSAWGPAPLARIEMDFNDFSRTLTVEGLSPDQVDAVFSTLRDDLINVSSLLGGPFQRNFIFYFLFILLISNIIGNLIWCIKNKIHPSFIPLSLKVICLIIILALPVREMFAGFSAVQGEASFFVRHSPVISFWGLVIALVGILVSYFLSKSKTGKTC